MLKRLLSMALVMVLLLSAVSLVSCSNKSEVMEKELLDVATISMWIVSENKVSAATEKLVEEAFSAITVSKYKVYVDLSFYTEDEYFGKLESKLEALQKEHEKIDEIKELVDEELEGGGKLTEEEIINNFFAEHPEYEPYREAVVGSNSGPAELQTEIVDGMSKPVYPGAKENQVDIVYIAGEDRYISYVENGWLAPLDEELAGVASKLVTYVSSPLLTGTKVGDATYAIPNNNEIGKYTYMLLDKDLCGPSHYFFDYTKVNSIVDCESFIEDVMRDNEGLAPGDAGYVLPIDSSFDECLNMLVWYWNIDIETTQKEAVDEDGYVYYDEEGNPLMVTDNKYTVNRENKFNVIGCLYGSPLNVNRSDITLGFNSLMADEEYRNILLTLKKYEFDNCFGEASEGQRAAISFMEGDYSVKKGWTDPTRGVYKDENGKEYYAIVVKYPQADESDIYGNMFGVTAFSKYVSESMKVITELNTNKELKNILQYGIEGTHYVIEKGALRRLNNDYMMNMDVTGNCFIAYPEEGKPADYWDNVKNQNSEALIDPLLGFDLTEIVNSYTMDPTEPAALDNAMIRDIAAMSEAIWAELESCKTYAEYARLLTGPTGSSTIKPIVDRLAYKGEEPIQFGNKTIALYKYCSGTYKPDSETGGEYYPFTAYLEWCANFK